MLKHFVRLIAILISVSFIISSLVGSAMGNNSLNSFTLTSTDGKSTTVQVLLPPIFDPSSTTVELENSELTKFSGDSIIVKPIIKRFDNVIRRYSQSLIITFPTARVGFIPYFSIDGKSWEELSSSTSLEVLTAVDSAFTVNDKGAIVIYTKIAGYFKLAIASTIPQPSASPTTSVTSSPAVTLAPTPTLSPNPIPTLSPPASIKAFIPSDYSPSLNLPLTSKDGVITSIQLFSPLSSDGAVSPAELESTALTSSYLGEEIIIKPVVKRLGEPVRRYARSVLIYVPKPKSKINLLPHFSPDGRIWDEVSASTSIEVLSSIDYGYVRDEQGATLIFMKIAGFLRMAPEGSLAVQSSPSPTPTPTPTPSKSLSASPSPTPATSNSPSAGPSKSPSLPGGDVIFPIVSVLNDISQMPSIAYYQLPRVVKVDLTKLKSISLKTREPITLEVSRLKPNILVAPIFVGASGSSIFLPSAKTSKKGILRLEPFVITSKGTYRVIIRTADETVMKLITLIVK